MLSAAFALAFFASVESGPTVSQDTAPAPKVQAAHKHVPSDSFAKEPIPLAATNFRRASRKASTILSRPHAALPPSPPSTHSTHALPAAAADVLAQCNVLRKYWQ